MGCWQEVLAAWAAVQKALIGVLNGTSPNGYRSAFSTLQGPLGKQIVEADRAADEGILITAISADLPDLREPPSLTILACLSAAAATDVNRDLHRTSSMGCEATQAMGPPSLTLQPAIADSACCPAVMLRLRVGGDLNQKLAITPDVYTVIHVVTSLKAPACLRALLEAGVNPNIRAGQDCQTPLHRLVLPYTAEMEQILLGTNASVWPSLSPCYDHRQSRSMAHAVNFATLHCCTCTLPCSKTRHLCRTHM